jgi:ABC-2 type transport system ATP-binding protein
MIQIEALTKRYGSTLALNELTFQVEPGRVTGFLGPNGAGKSTTLRLLLGLAAPTGGRALVEGVAYGSLSRPLSVVGALLDATAVPRDRTAVDHLRILARTHRIGDERVVSLLEKVGLGGVARRRLATFSLGMLQRLGLAAALLGDPRILLLDEPVNGLDPDGVRWLRELLRGLAAGGRTILVSSHLMTEMELTADHLVIIGRGRLIADEPIGEIASRFERSVLVRANRQPALADVLEAAGARASVAPGGGLEVVGLDAPSIGRLALGAGIALEELTPHGLGLEEAYVRLTRGALDHAAGGMS